MELKRGGGEQTWKYEKISEPIDKYFYSSVIIMIMLKMAIDVMCKNKSMENRESKKMHVRVMRRERDGVVETSQRNGKITHFINLTVNWMDSDEISACVIQHICEYMYGSYNSCRRNDRTAYARTHNLMTTCSNCDSS